MRDGIEQVVLDLYHARGMNFSVILYNWKMRLPLEDWTPGVGDHVLGDNSWDRMTLYFVGSARSELTKLTKTSSAYPKLIHTFVRCFQLGGMDLLEQVKFQDSSIQYISKSGGK